MLCKILFNPLIRNVFLKKILTNPEFDISWVRDAWLFSDPAGQPVITTNYSNSIPSIETGVSGLTLANTTQIYPEDRGQNYSFRLGERAAEVIDERN